jgi:adenylate cyclase
MAPDLVNELLKNPGKLSYGGTYQEISVLFSDIRSFTTYTESHNPTETVNILKEYLTAMVSVIIRNKGTLDKFVGDEIMALYGSPLPLENHALHACKTALEMREKLAELQDKWKAEGKDSFEMGIGINTGGAIVGTWVVSRSLTTQPLVIQSIWVRVWKALPRNTTPPNTSLSAKLPMKGKRLCGSSLP